MKSAHRLRSRLDFERVWREGRRVRRPELSVAVAAGRSPRARVGFAVGRQLGSAVVRNRVRRRMREAIRPLVASLPPCDVVIGARSSAATAGVAGLRDALESALIEAGLLVRSSSLHNRDTTSAGDNPGPPGPD